MTKIDQRLKKVGSVPPGQPILHKDNHIKLTGIRFSDRPPLNLPS